MIKSLVVILAIVGASLHYGDLESDSVLYSILLPLASAISLIALAIWFVMLLYRRGIGQKTHRRVGDIDFLDVDPGGGD
jgi:hypothetical protein